MTYVYAKVTRYTNTDGKITRWASQAQPMWVRGKPASSSDYSFTDDKVIYAPKLPGDLGESISVINNDTYELVDAEDLPDEVCAVLARWALVGEDAEEEE